MGADKFDPTPEQVERMRHEMNLNVAPGWWNKEVSK